MLVSIYGEHLGPTLSCTGNADTTRRETPAPTRQRQSFAETLIFPTELCGVQVFLAGRAAGILYVSDTQINFKVPQDSPLEGEAELKVVFRDQEHSVTVRAGMDNVALSLDRPAHAEGAVWLRIEPPFGWSDQVRYPIQIEPWDFGCRDIEVRRNGQPPPRIVVRSGIGGVLGGNPCGGIGIPGHAATHTGRLPIHLQYRFDQPGAYEVRYTERDFFRREIIQQSEWTRITILPADPRPAATPPMPLDPADVLSDWLPNQLGNTSASNLDAVVRCLYHPESIVRRFAAAALRYWTEDEVRRHLTASYLSQGPSDVIVDDPIQLSPELLVKAAPYLQSSDRVLLRGAVRAATRLQWKQPTPAMEQAMLDAAEHIVRTADEQTVTEYVAALGSVKDDRGKKLLWDLVSRGVATEQALIAITWRKDLGDLPRLSAILEGPLREDKMNRQLSSLPYALRNSYGRAALPYLETALKNSRSVWILESCARELILAGRHSGFAFAVDAITTNKTYKLELLQFIRGQFPELRNAGESEVLAFLSKR
jgi:hypothetical protein